MNIRRGVVTQPDNPVSTYYQTASDLGLEYVEVMLDGPTDRHWLATDAEELISEYNSLGLVVHLPFEGIDLGSPVDGIRESVVTELHKCHAAAEAAGASKSVLHPNVLAWEKAYDTDVLIARVVEAVRMLRKRAESDGLDITITVENIYNSAVKLCEFETFLDQTGVAMTFDTGHARIEGYDQQAMEEFIINHASEITHFHLNDTRRPADEHLPVGAGSIDFVGLFEALPRDWAGSASLEVTTPNMDYIEHSTQHLETVLSQVDG